MHKINLINKKGLDVIVQKYKTVIIYRHINNHTGDLRLGHSLWDLVKVLVPLSKLSLLHRFFPFQ